MTELGSTNERSAKRFTRRYLPGSGGFNLSVVFAVAVLAVLAWVAATTPGFFTVSNAQAILASMSFTGLVAIGITFIMINGNLFSLSVGSTVAVCAMVFTAALGLGVPTAAALSILTGFVVSAIQGTIVGLLKASPIVVTLAAASLMEGVAAWMTSGRSLVPPGSVSGFHELSATFAGYPVSVFVLVVVAILAQLLLTRSRFGRSVFLVGSSTPAAFSAGLPVVRITTFVFGIAGVCAAIAGMLLASLNNNATLAVAGTYNYDGVAAAVVGGTAVAGGRGSVARTLVGAIFITAVGDMMLLRNYGLGPQILAKGIMVLCFVILFNNQRRNTR